MECLTNPVILPAPIMEAAKEMIAMVSLDPGFTLRTLRDSKFPYELYPMALKSSLYMKLTMIIHFMNFKPIAK